MDRDGLTFGIMLASFGEQVNREYLRRNASLAEDRGFDTVWTGEHVAFPEHIPDEYPFSPDGSAPPSQDLGNPTYDVFSVLSFLASETDDVSLGTNVCIAPYRNPVLLTKQALSVDSLSDGRFEFGLGSGWLRTEFDALDVPFEERGSRTDEFLEIFERACGEHEFAFDGPHHSFPKTGFYPAPADEDGPPLWIGGYSGAAFRRTAEFGDGWSIYGLRPDAVGEARDRLMNAWRDFDRDGEPPIAAGRSVYVGTDSDLDPSRPLIGEAEDVIADIEAYREAGATHIVMDFFTMDPAAQREQIERFAGDVMPAFR